LNPLHLVKMICDDGTEGPKPGTCHVNSNNNGMLWTTAHSYLDDLYLQHFNWGTM